jgi:hypothetical protein
MVKNPEVANERMTEVRDALKAHSVDLPDLQVWLVDGDGVIEQRALGGL